MDHTDDTDSAEFDALFNELRRAHKGQTQKLQDEIKELKCKEEENKVYYNKICTDLKKQHQNNKVLLEHNNKLRVEVTNLKDTNKNTNCQKCKRCEQRDVEFSKERDQWLQLIEEKEHKICALETKLQNLEKKSSEERERNVMNVMNTSPVCVNDEGSHEESQVFGRINKPLNNKLSMNRDRRKVRYEELKRISPDEKLSVDRNVDIKKYGGKEKNELKIKHECVDSQETERPQLSLNNRRVVSVPDSCEPDMYSGSTQDLTELPRKLDIQDTQDVRRLREPSARVLVPDTCYPDTMAMMQSPVIVGNPELREVNRVKVRRGQRDNNLRDGPELTAVPETLDVNDGLNVDTPEPLSLLMSPPTSTSTPAVERCRVSMDHEKTSLLKGVAEKLFRKPDNRKSRDLDMLTPIQQNESQHLAATHLPSPMFTEKLENRECDVVQRLQFSEIPGHSRSSFLDRDESHTSPLLIKPLVTRHRNDDKLNMSPDVNESSSPTKKPASPSGKENSPIQKGKSSQEKRVHNPKKRQLLWEQDAIDSDETCIIEPPQKCLKRTEEEDSFRGDETAQMTRSKLNGKNDLNLCEKKKKRMSRKKPTKFVQSTLTQTFGADGDKKNDHITMEMHYNDKTFKDKFAGISASNIEFKKPVSPRIVHKRSNNNADCSTNLEINSDENSTIPGVMNGSVDPALQLSELEEASDFLLGGCKSPTFDKSNFQGDKSESLLCSELANCSESLKFGAVDINYARGRDLEDTDMTYLSPKTGIHDGGADSKKYKKKETEMSEESAADDSCVDMFGGSHDNNDEENDTDVYKNDRHYDNQSLETSFDRVPKSSTSPNYKHVEVVRKKDARKKLKGFNCRQCEEYFGGLELNDEEKLERMKFCSRHRGKHTPPRTPEHYWELDMPSTQTCVERGYMKTANEKQPLRKRRRQPYQQKF